MVAKMMRWRPWPPPPSSKKYGVKLVVRRLDGCDPAPEDGRLTVEIKWKGPRGALLRRTAVKRNFTREEGFGHNGVVSWDEEFDSNCTLVAYKENQFHPWEIGFTVFNGLNQTVKSKVPVVGTASLNLAEYVSSEEQKEFELSLPLTNSGGSSDPPPSLCIFFNLVELRTTQDSSSNPEQRAIVRVPDPPSCVEAGEAEKDDLSALKAGLKKVKIFTEYVSVRRAKKPCHEEDSSEGGKCSGKSDDGEYTYPFDTDSLDDSEEGESEEVREENSSARKSFSYGTLPHANYVGGSFCSTARVNGEDEALVYYSNRRKSDVGCSGNDDPIVPVSQQSQLTGSKRGILSWRKRKLSFRSPKARGEPLLKKAYAEEGGDDIDYDRRQLSSDESLTFKSNKTEEDSSANRLSVSEFGDDNFAIGSWEQKEVVSRDGFMKLQTQVFFASIDQRSERAAGESACTALVAVIADWFQTNPFLMPIKSQFDTLIRDGSLEWRKLCEDKTYRERFPDKHFDLETILQAKIRPLSVLPGKSFIGFFHPDGMDEERFEFLNGAMSFDEIWEEISHHAASSGCSVNEGTPHVYIVSWNDHFFILMVESEAYYIIDTLGERLYEGCGQAYILKFDSNTTISKVGPNAADQSSSKSADEPTSTEQGEKPNEDGGSANGVYSKSEDSSSEAKSKEEEEEEEKELVVCRGKDSCKEYIKSFLASIPIQELLVDMKKGLISSTPLHHRLQIEFHYTQTLAPALPELTATEVAEAEVA